jgi:hypothetical protein
MRLEVEELVLEFKSLVGRPSTWISRERFPDENTCKAEMCEITGGKPGAQHTLSLKRIP